MCSYMFYNQVYELDSAVDFTLHTCDNRPCVNPYHLYLGDDPDNKKDMLDRKRQARGERQGCARLTDALVLEMKLEFAKGWITYADIARKYDISWCHAKQIILG